MDWADFAAQLPAPHTILIEAYAGTSAYGPAFAPVVSVTPCLVDHKRRRVRVSTQDAAGAEVISSTTVYCPPGTVAPPLSRVTLPSGDVAKVLDAAVHDAAGLPIPDHVELMLE
jgi:hypothetical protein